MDIRACTQDDLRACVDLMIAAYNAEPFNDFWTPETAGKRLADFFNTPGFFGLVAERDSSVLGFLMGATEQWCTGKQFHVRELCVSEEFRGRGLGAHLMERLTEHLVEMDAESIFIIAPRHSGAEQFLFSCGFVPVEQVNMYALRI